MVTEPACLKGQNVPKLLGNAVIPEAYVGCCLLQNKYQKVYVTRKVGVHAKWLCFSCVRLFATLWTVVHQAPLSMTFSRQEYWSALPFPPPEDLPSPGIESSSVSCIANAFFTTAPPGKPLTRKVPRAYLGEV